MNSGKTARRLAAVMVADVAGYSTLMEADESGTLAALKRHRERLFEPAVAGNNGRIVKLMGDGALVEFASVVDAVNCAIAVQNAGAADLGSPPIILRIGINLGDIIVDGDDIYGEGVNIAARLQGLALPGGVCISATVHESIAGRVSVPFSDGGEVGVKNIARPVRVWKWHPADGAGSEAPPPRGGSDGVNIPALAVLPFQNMGGDPAEDYFADGVVEDIITRLSRFRSFAVIARNSTFVYKGRPVDVRAVGRDLGARYVLEGSVRRAGRRLRVTAQLVDSAGGAHLWAQSYDGALDDVFDVQDRITEGVVALIEPQIKRAEFERSRRERPESVDVYDLYLRGLHKAATHRPADNAEAIRLFEEVVARNPDYASALASAANAYEYRLTMAWPPVGPDDRSRAIELAQAAIAAGGDDAVVLARAGLVMAMVAREYEQGRLILDRAVEANPNDVTALYHAGIGHLIGGDLDVAQRFFDRVIRLTPGDSLTARTAVANIDLVRGRYAAAAEGARRSLAEHPTFEITWWVLAAAEAYLGHDDEARRAVSGLVSLVPGLTLQRLRAAHHTRDPSRAEIVFEGLRRAGLPER